MKKPRKSRAVTADIRFFTGVSGEYATPVPYDKKDRVIPSSVECAYNTEYFSLADVLGTLRTL